MHETDGQGAQRVDGTEREKESGGGVLGLCAAPEALRILGLFRDGNLITLQKTGLGGRVP